MRARGAHLRSWPLSTKYLLSLGVGIESLCESRRDEARLLAARKAAELSRFDRPEGAEGASSAASGSSSTRPICLLTCGPRRLGDLYNHPETRTACAGGELGRAPPMSDEIEARTSPLLVCPSAAAASASATALFADAQTAELRRPVGSRCSDADTTVARADGLAEEVGTERTEEAG